MSIDAQIAGLAASQDGVFHASELRALGLSSDAIDGRVQRKRLVRVQPEVLALPGAALSFIGRCRAALLSLGDDSCLAHAACGAVYGATDEPDVISVICPTERRDRVGVKVRVAALEPQDRWNRRELAITSPCRLVLDLAATEPREIVERVYNELQVLRLLTRRQLLDALPRWKGRRGVALLRELAADDVGVSLSPLEDLLIPLVKQAGLPLPLRNQKVEGYLVDAVWHKEGVIVELDSRGFHDTDPRFESDRARSNALMARGWLVLRLTYRRLKREPFACVAELAAVLSARAPQPIAGA